MREARGKIRREFLKALEEYPSEKAGSFDAAEYARFKKY